MFTTIYYLQQKGGSPIEPSPTTTTNNNDNNNNNDNHNNINNNNNNSNNDNDNTNNNASCARMPQSSLTRGLLLLLPLLFIVICWY